MSTSAALVLCAYGCGDSRAASDIAHTPLQGLHGVRLGMTAEELTEVRPNAVLSPYRGYVEQVNDVSVAYVVERGAAQQNTVTASAEVEAIITSVDAKSPQIADSLWRSIVADVRADHGNPDQCREIRGIGGGIDVMWNVGRALLLTGQRSPGGSENNHRIVIMLMHPAPSESESVRQVDCSTIF